MRIPSEAEAEANRQTYLLSVDTERNLWVLKHGWAIVPLVHGYGSESYGQIQYHDNPAEGVGPADLATHVAKTQLEFIRDSFGQRSRLLVRTPGSEVVNEILIQ